MSDRGLPISPMHMNGYGSHTYSFINARGERHWVKFHFKTQQGHKFYTNREAEAVIGKNREVFPGGSVRCDRSRRVSALEDCKCRSCRKRTSASTGTIRSTSPKFGRTRTIRRSTSAILSSIAIPTTTSSKIELAAFSPSNVVPGISWSPDKMLQARIFSYADAHRYRLGTHYEALPVNAPRCPVHNYHKDGAMRFFPSGDQSGCLLRAQLVRWSRSGRAL